jgi:hypothetical protein
MKVSFEIDSCQEWKITVGGKRLPCPEKNWSKQRADQNCRGEVNQ